MTSDQIEKLLLRAVLDDLKGGGSHPLSTPMRSRCELGERLRLATGLPTSAITRFLEIPRSTWYYHRSRARAGRGATTRCGPSSEAAFEECGRRGYRARPRPAAPRRRPRSGEGRAQADAPGGALAPGGGGAGVEQLRRRGLARASQPAAPRTTAPTTSAPRPPTSCGSPTSPSSGDRPAPRSTCPR